MEIEPICNNCNYYFPASMTELTEFGICLNDDEFAPFLDELLDKGNYDCCQNLVDAKKFVGDREACADFDPVEDEVEIDENSEFVRALKSCIHNGQVDSEKLKDLLIEEYLQNLDLKTLPVERYVNQLFNAIRLEEQNSAIGSLGALISHGNEEAFNALLSFLKKLPPPKTIGEVHLRIRILRNLEYPEFKTSLTTLLLHKLENTPSNNTTRQWISAIFKHLESAPHEEIREPLGRMLHDSRFSYRLKKRIKSILYGYSLEI